MQHVWTKFRLIQWVAGTKDIRYRYDSSGRRILKEDANGSFPTTLYFYDGWQCVEETDASGALVRSYVYGEGIDEILRASLPDIADLDGDLNTTELTDLYYHDNSLGSAVAVTDTNGNVVESYRYTAYGEVTIFDRNNAQVPETQLGQPFMFTGRRLDFEEGSGLYYYRLRYYDPASGRFVSRDPLGIWGDADQLGNGQNYCRNNPVNWVDPFGLQDAESSEGVPYGTTMPKSPGNMDPGRVPPLPPKDDVSDDDPRGKLPATPAESPYLDPVVLMITIAKADRWYWVDERDKDNDFLKYKAGKIDPDEIRNTNCSQFVALAMEFSHHDRCICVPPMVAGMQPETWQAYKDMMGSKLSAAEKMHASIMDWLNYILPDYSGYFRLKPIPWKNTKGMSKDPRWGDLFMTFETDAKGNLVDFIHTGLFIDKEKVVHSIGAGIQYEPKISTYTETKEWGKKAAKGKPTVTYILNYVPTPK